MTLHTVNVEFVTGNIVRTEVVAQSEEAARELQLLKYAAYPWVVKSISAWPVDRAPVTVNLGGHRAPVVFDSAFGALV